MGLGNSLEVFAPRRFVQLRHILSDKSSRLLLNWAANLNVVHYNGPAERLCRCAPHRGRCQSAPLNLSRAGSGWTDTANLPEYARNGPRSLNETEHCQTPRISSSPAGREEFGVMKGNNTIPGLFPVFQQQLSPDRVVCWPYVGDQRFARSVFPQNPAAKYKDLLTTMIVVKQPKTRSAVIFNRGARL